MAVRLGIVIVHYNTPDDLGRCLHSLQAEPPACSHEIVVVDNASTVPGLDEVQERFAGVRWLRNAENGGYGRGCNQGMALVPADYYLILNPDIVVLPGALDSLVAFAEAHPRAGLVGPQLLNEDGTIQESCRRFYTFWTLLLRRTFLGKLLPNNKTVARHLMRDFDHTTVRAVDWVLGGCLLVRREALDRCGPMDDRFFLYFEDVDWCYRMWQCGYEVLYTPDSRFVHRHRRASASGAFSRSFWLHLASLISFYEKWSLVVYVAKKWRRPVAVVLHWVLDMALLAVSLLGAYGLRSLLQPMFDSDVLRLSWYAGWFSWAALMVTVAFALMGRYRPMGLRDRFDWLAHGRQMALVALVLLSGSYLGRDQVVSRAVLLIFLAFYAGLSAWATVLVRRASKRLERGYLALERTLLAGPRADLEAWFAASGDRRVSGLDVVGYVTDDTAMAAGHPALGGGVVPWLGRPADLPDLVERFRASQVAFWQRPDGPVAWNALLQLRRARIRLRWIIEESWLLDAGARSDRFGSSASGVLDPDDGLAIRRWAWRPLEVLVALPLLLVATVLLPWRRWRRARGTCRRHEVDVGVAGVHIGSIEIEQDADGRTCPLWWQHGLLRALAAGRVGLVGTTLHGSDRDADPARQLRDGAVGRPGLTGRWSRSEGAESPDVHPLVTFFMNPGGCGPLDPAAEFGSTREGEGEVPRP